MAKPKRLFVCSNCQWSTSKWTGQCGSCELWNTIEEQVLSTAFQGKSPTVQSALLTPLSAVSSQGQARMVSGIAEWDRVTGGGITPGAFMVLSGDPGVGKSTLLLQVAHKLSEKNYSVVYISSEESLSQVKTRATRLQLPLDQVQFSDQNRLDSIAQAIESTSPDLVIIDSIQSCYVSSETTALPGSISQLREAAFLLMRLAKESNTSILATAHITKEGTMAGPKLLEHMVDTVLYLQGDGLNTQGKVLRTLKNRFGTINEVGFFEMNARGMSEVEDINAHTLEQATHSPGAVLVCSFEGTRPYLIEMQALCLASKLNNPQRVISGVDYKRVVLIAAILEKYLKIKLSAHDIFFKAEGGLTLKESSSDLGIALALLSSYLQKPLPQKSLAIGEVSLTGHIRPVPHLEQRTAEGSRFSVPQIIVGSSRQNKKKILDEELKSECISVTNVYQLLSLFPEESSQ